MSLIHNERVKLTASWINTLAGAAAGGGAIAPLIAVFYTTPPSTDQVYWLTAKVLAWLLIGGALHLLAVFTLGRLKP